MNMDPFFSSLLAVKRDIPVTFLLSCICVHCAPVTFLLSCICVHCAQVRAYIQICPGHNSHIYAWISKLFDTVVVLGKEKCHLKHFLLG